MHNNISIVVAPEYGKNSSPEYSKYGGMLNNDFIDLLSLSTFM